MKNTKTTKLFAWLSGSLYLLGTLFKIQHWPGASMGLVLGSFLYLFFYLPLWLSTCLKQKQFQYYYWSQFFSLAVFILSTLFKIMHWPWATNMFYVFCIVFLLFFIPSYILKIKSKAEKDIDNSHLTLLITIVFAVFFVYNGGLISKVFLQSMSLDGARIESAIEKQNSKTKQLYQSFELIKDKNHNSNYAKAKQLELYSNTLIEYIEKTKSYLISRADNIPASQADTTKIEDLKNSLRIDIPTLIMMNDDSLLSGTNRYSGIKLKEKVDFFYQHIVGLVEDEQKEIIIQGINLSTSNVYDKANDVDEPWISYMFNHIPMNVAITNLLALEYEIKNAESQILTNLLNNASSLDQSNLAAQIAELAVKYDSEKKEQKLALMEKDKQLFDAKLHEKQKDIDSKNNTIAIFILCMLAFSVMIFFVIRSNIARRRLNSELAKQKVQVEQKNIEILDSIEYAKRIQNTILPPQKIVSQYLENSFILYLPKDIVAGDFYWFAPPQPSPKRREQGIPNSNERSSNFTSTENSPRELEGTSILFAACDCTGHGVPGAMVSVVCSNALNKAVKEFQIDEPAKLLDKVAELVVADLSKNNEEGDEINDGMDASICKLNTQTLVIEWSGANNPLWIIRNGAIQEIKANKQPIGRTDYLEPFTNHKVQLQAGDSIYLFTDGYADQFGGEKGKKFSKNKFKELLLSIQHLPMSEQREALYHSHMQWRGTHEQVDDICVIGVRV